MDTTHSPFPGLDPYVQRFWRDVHARLVNYTAEAFSGRLPGGLRARIEERLIVEQPLDDPQLRDIVPDLYIVERKRRSGEAWRGMSQGGVAVAEPITIRLTHQPLRETFIEIREPGTGGRVITIIEFLSPANKAGGQATAQYRRKQQECRDAQVTLVEIDFTRGGQHIIAAPVEKVPEEMLEWPRACVEIGWEIGVFEFYPMSLRERLPAIAIPLRRSDRPCVLDLQTVFDRCYEVGEYGLDIDYRKEPRPPFSPGDAEWADALLREKGLRG